MKKTQISELQHRFGDQHGVVSRSELRRLGITAKMERDRVARGEWARIGARVVRLAGSPSSPEQALMAAVLEAGPACVASHQSAAWLWGLLGPPARHSVSVPRSAHRRSPEVDVHRPVDLAAAFSTRSGISCTNPLRTLVDLAGVVPADLLDEAVDRALGRRLVTVESLEAEIRRLARSGRTGVGVLRLALKRRGLVGAPHPSVLESRVLRLLHFGGIVPLAVEVAAGVDGRYRIDTMLDPVVAMEVDGYTYHSSPEAKGNDERRRNRIRLAGIFLMVYDWVDVSRDGRRVLSECRQALRTYGSAARSQTTGTRSPPGVAHWAP